jgi:molybdate transport system substrate-binding protein
MKVSQLAVLVTAALACKAALAADINVLSTVAVQAALERIQPQFEHQTGHHLHLEYGSSSALKRQMTDGKPFDVTLLTRDLVNDLVKQGKVAQGTTAGVGKTGMGIAVGAGAPKPDVSSRESLRKTLLSATGIAYPRDGQSGIVAQHVFDELGITNEIKPRVHVDPRPAGALLAVGEGHATVAFAALSEIAANSTVELAGPLPGDLQTYVEFTVGSAPAARDPGACKAFIAFLRTPEARRQFRIAGLETE